MLSRFLRQVLFTLVHSLINVLVAIQNVYHKIWVQEAKLSSREVTKADLQLLLTHVPKMNKKLQHLVVLADTERHTYSDLARLIIWSLVAGISYVSFHDITGKLKQEEDSLFYEVEKNKKGIPGCVKWSNKPDLNGYTNGIQAHTVIVNIFTPDDGRPTIAQCIQSIAEDKIKCVRASNEYTTQELDKVFYSMYPSFPDPELVLYSGSSCCTYGLLPWHIRLTEFIQLSLDYSVNIHNFIGALYKYSKCDQRYGK